MGNNMAAARAARAKNAADRKAERVWVALEPRLRRNPCKCNLKRGMVLSQLRKLGAGCTAPEYVCPNLDAYRRIVENIDRVGKQ